MNQPTGLIRVLLDRNAPFGDRDDAAMDLAAYDDPDAEDALMQVVTSPNEDEDILDAAVDSLREIRGRKGKSDQPILDLLPPKARAFWEGNRESVVPIPPVLSVHESYLMPVSASDFGVLGELNFEEGCLNGCTYIDSTGREWMVKDAQFSGYKNFVHHILPRRYREIRVAFKFNMGRQYSLEELKILVGDFLRSKNLVGQPFLDKSTDVPAYLDKFTSIPQLIAELGYFDARHQ